MFDLKLQKFLILQPATSGKLLGKLAGLRKAVAGGTSFIPPQDRHAQPTENRAYLLLYIYLKFTPKSDCYWNDGLEETGATSGPSD